MGGKVIVVTFEGGKSLLFEPALQSSDQERALGLGEIDAKALIDEIAQQHKLVIAYLHHAVSLDFGEINGF